MKTRRYCGKGRWCPTPFPLFWKEDFYSARVLLNPPLPHLCPTTSPSRVVGTQPEPRLQDPGPEKKGRAPASHFHPGGSYQLTSDVNRPYREGERELPTGKGQNPEAETLAKNLANPEQLPRKLGTLFRAACKGTSHPPLLPPSLQTIFWSC